MWKALLMLKAGAVNFRNGAQHGVLQHGAQRGALKLLLRVHRLWRGDRVQHGHDEQLPLHFLLCGVCELRCDALQLPDDALQPVRDVNVS